MVYVIWIIWGLTQWSFNFFLAQLKTRTIYRFIVVSDAISIELPCSLSFEQTSQDLADALIIGTKGQLRLWVSICGIWLARLCVVAAGNSLVAVSVLVEFAKLADLAACLGTTDVVPLRIALSCNWSFCSKNKLSFAGSKLICFFRLHLPIFLWIKPFIWVMFITTKQSILICVVLMLFWRVISTFWG